MATDQDGTWGSVMFIPKGDTHSNLIPVSLHVNDLWHFNLSQKCRAPQAGRRACAPNRPCELRMSSGGSMHEEGLLAGGGAAERRDMACRSPFPAAVRQSG